MSSAKVNVSVVGATGAVGREFVRILEDRKFPIDQLKLFASEESLGKTIEYQSKNIPLEILKEDSFKGIDISFFAGGGSLSKAWVSKALQSGSHVVDNSSAFRMNKEVPLVVPEINGSILKNIKQASLVANPNCSTAQLVLPLHALQKAYGLSKVIVSTYQSVSGAGRKGISELSQQVTDLYNYRDIKVDVFPHRIAFNVIPQIGNFDENGYCEEELKIMNETKKILDLPDLQILATTVRVPTYHGHAESVWVETCETLGDIAEIKRLFTQFPGIKVVDDPQSNEYPMVHDIYGTDDAWVGRIRKDMNNPKGLLFWVCADNLRKGAALNGVQIGEILLGSLTKK